MDMDHGMLERLASKDVQYTLHLDGATYPVESVTITDHSAVPKSDVIKPSYRINGKVMDPKITARLTGKMLGPNTDFEELLIVASIPDGGNAEEIHIFANLVNSIQTPASVEIGMEITRTA